MWHRVTEREWGSKNPEKKCDIFFEWPLMCKYCPIANNQIPILFEPQSF